MSRTLCLMMGLGLLACTAGCAQELVYADRVGTPRVRRTKVTLPVLPGEAVPPGGQTPETYTLGVAFPPFPLDGTQLRCAVVSVPENYALLARAMFMGAKRPAPGLVMLKTLGGPPDFAGRPREIALRIAYADTPLPLALRPGDPVTLRFLKDGRFFDVKEWATLAEPEK